MQGRTPPLPESLTRHLSEPRAAIRPTPGDRHRARVGPGLLRAPSRVHRGVWLWAAAFNAVGGAILFALWRSMGA